MATPKVIITSLFGNKIHPMKLNNKVGNIKFNILVFLIKIKCTRVIFMIDIQKEDVIKLLTIKFKHDDTLTVLNGI